MTTETPGPAQDESIDQAVQAAATINGTPVSDRLKADIQAKPTGPRPPVGTRIINPGEVDLSGSAAHLEPGNPKNFELPKRVEVIDANQSPGSAAKRAAVKIALGQSFGEQVGAGTAQQIDMGVRGISDRRAVTKDGEVRTPDAPLKPGYPTANHASGPGRVDLEVRSDRPYDDDLSYLAD